MGLIKALTASVGDVMGEQWKEYFYCDSLPADVIAAMGEKRNTKGKSNKRGADNIISNGSVIAVAPGQCMMIVEQGKVVEICAEPGEFIYDSSTEPSLFVGDLGEQVKKTLANIGKRFTYGGEAPKDQRVYYINTKEIMGNKYGTPQPVPFRVIDKNIGLDMDISIRCFGEYSFKISDPVLFFTNVCGNFAGIYTRKNIEPQLKTELLTALQPAFAEVSKCGVRYSEIAAHTEELTKAIDDVLSDKWHNIRGIEVVSMGISSVSASDEDEDLIKELQKTAVLRNPTMAAARLTDAQAEAIQNAAANENAGAAMAFMGLGMANMASNGLNAQGLYAMGNQTPAQPAAEPTPTGWTCSCGTSGNTGKFCMECGSKKPEESGWNCPSCGTLNKGKFCMECGSKKPADALQYKCDKCDWEPEDPSHPPKFCPECGDPFGDEDIK